MRAKEPGHEQNRQPQDDRESIWSITRTRRALYFGLFSLYAFAGIGFLIWYHVFERRTDTWPEIILSITQGIGVNTVGAAGLALLTIEGPKTVMVLADYIEERWVKPLRERNRAEAEARRAKIRAEEEARQARIRAEEEARQARIRAEEEAHQARIRAEGQAQIQAAWEAWNGRRLAAEANGEPFDEPPPELPAPPQQDDGEPPPGTSSTESE